MIKIRERLKAEIEHIGEQCRQSVEVIEGFVNSVGFSVEYTPEGDLCLVSKSGESNTAIDYWKKVTEAVNILRVQDNFGMVTFDAGVCSDGVVTYGTYPKFTLKLFVESDGVR